MRTAASFALLLAFASAADAQTRQTTGRTDSPRATRTVTTRLVTSPAASAGGKPATADETAASFSLFGMGVLSLVCVGAVLLLFNFLPTFVAGMRGHPNAAAIFILNLLLGWTVIGWIVALVWAFTAIDRPRPYGR